MSDEALLMQKACLAAAADLGVDIVVPFELVDTNGKSEEFIACFPNFGTRLGTLVCHFEDWPHKQVIASENGYFCSGLHPMSYSQYDRELFIESFDDWGWQGEAFARPPWCKG